MIQFISRLYGQIDKLNSLYWRILGKASKLNIDVLMYHNVTDENIVDNPSCICTIERFKYGLSQYKSNGYRFIPVTEIDSVINSNEGKYAVVTFDDIPDNVFSNAYPILKELQIPFTIFIATCFIDKPGFISKEKLVELSKDTLCTIGAHTKSHYSLRLSSISCEEIIESKAILERITGLPVSYFAYPYGRRYNVSKKNMREAKEAGFKMAFGTINSPISSFNKKCKFYYPRIVRN